MAPKNKEQEKEIEAGAETPLSPAPSPAKMTMDDLSADEALPQVQENAIAAVKQDTEQKIQKEKANGFDPNIHATNDDGTPKKTASGNFAKKRGRKSTLNTGQKSAKQIEQEEQELKAKEENKQSAAVISAILEQAQMKFISEEFEYSDRERAANQAVWEATLEYYGGVNIPPPVALAMDHMTIILSRAQKPKVKDKFGHLKLWFKQKFTRKPKYALSNSGQDSERKDDLRKEESKEPAKAGI